MIKAGDLAVVIKWPCCGHYLGFLIKVENFKHFRQRPQCMQCEAPAPDGPFVEDAKNIFPVSWLKRIPPLSELESEKDRLPTPEEFEQRLQKAISSLKAI